MNINIIISKNNKNILQIRETHDKLWHNRRGGVNQCSGVEVIAFAYLKYVYVCLVYQELQQLFYLDQLVPEL